MHGLGEAGWANDVHSPAIIYASSNKLELPELGWGGMPLDHVVSWNAD